MNKISNILRLRKFSSYSTLALFFIVVLSILLRFNQLGINPPSINWDETSIGYNAYSILKTGNDEYGNRFPLSFRSFDDFKPPVYIYLTVPSIAIFGLSEFAVRVPAALFGTLAVVIFYLLVREVLKNFPSSQREQIALLSAFFMAVSPWHLQFSRAAYEGNIGLFFLISAIYAFFVGLRRGYFLLLSSILFILSIYSYHSFRLIAPIFLVVLLIIFWKELLSKKKPAIISAVIFVIFSLPVYSSLVLPSDVQARLSMVSIFSESDSLKDNLRQLQVSRENNNIIGEIVYNRRAFYFREGLKGYFDHFTPNFLFVTGAGSFHHHAVNFGMMYLWDLPFLFAGLYLFIRRIDKRILVMLSLLLLAPLPSSIATGAPHGVRAIAMVPTLLFALAFGFYFVTIKIRAWKNTIVSRFLILGIILAFLINFVIYLNQYYVETPRLYGYFWQAGNKEAILKARELEKNYDEIIMSYRYDQPYIYYLFYNKFDPKTYQENWSSVNQENERFYRKIGKYSFKNINISELQNRETNDKTLLIATPDEVSKDLKPIYIIYFPDGKIAYKFIEI